MLGSRAAGQRGSGAVLAIARMGSCLRRIAGMPDYHAYLEHVRSAHPERAVPTQQEFYADFVRSRYEDGPTRCC
jgi:uncharacterized short protein YbdD (DUF466 family)